jgi:hypothetical protein
VKRLVFIGFFLEFGFVLIVIPWSAFWDRNYFAQVVPSLEQLITNNFFRGAVSGLGVINVIAGVSDLLSMLLARPAERPASINPTHFAKDQ